MPELVVVDARHVVRLEVVTAIAADAVDEAAGVIAIGRHLVLGIRIGDAQQAVPGVVLVCRLIGYELIALDRDGAGLLDDLAQRAVLPVLGAGPVSDQGDAPGQVEGWACLVGGAIGVGDVVGREERVVDPHQPVELVGVGDELAGRQLFEGEVVGEVIGEAGEAGIGTVDLGAATELVVDDAGNVVLVVGDAGDLAQRIVGVGGLVRGAADELVHRGDERAHVAEHLLLLAIGVGHRGAQLGQPAAVGAEVISGGGRPGW